MSDNEFLGIILICLLLFTLILFVSPKAEKTSTYSIIQSSNIEQDTKAMPDQTSLPYSIIGEDYLRTYSDITAASAWNSTYMQYFNKWNCNTARLGFAFSDAPVTGDGTHTHSMYVESKMDDVLEIFDGYNIKVILDNHNYVDHANYAGTQAWVDNWKAIATHYLDDDRIAGFNIFNEPNLATWADDGDYTSVGIIDTKEKLIEVFKYCIDQIRVIDSDRTIFFPVCYGMGIGLDNATTLHNLLVTYGVTALNNIVYDIGHPYYFENAWDLYATPYLSPEQVALNFRNNIILPSVAYYTSENCWIGETAAFANKTDNYQVRWLKSFINACCVSDVGFQVWAFFGKIALQEDAMALSNYPSYPLAGDPPEDPEPPIPPPPETYYHVTVSNAGNGSTAPSGYVKQPSGQPLTAIGYPDVDYKFYRWKLNNFNVSTNPIFVLNGIENYTYTLVAHFEADTPVEPDPPTPPAADFFSVNIGTSTGGTTSLTGNQTLPVGQTLTVSITKINDNYRFNYYLLDNANWGTNQTFTLAGTANTSYTLLPVFQYVSPPLPNVFVPPGDENIGMVSRNKTYPQIKRQLLNSPKPKFRDILDLLKRNRV